MKTFAIYLTILATIAVCIPAALVQLANHLPPTQTELALGD